MSRTEHELGRWDSDHSIRPDGRDAEVPPADSQRASERFRSLADEWHSRPLTLSMMSQIVSHPAYQTIVAEAKANPELWSSMILRELEERPARWYEALKAITGTTPVSPEERGQPARVREAWLRWGQEQGLLPPIA